MEKSDQYHRGEIRLIGQGKWWGTLRLIDGRLLLECKRQSRRVSFDLLASVENGRAVSVRDAAESRDHA